MAQPGQKDSANKELFAHLRRLQKLHKKYPETLVFSSLSSQYRQVGMTSEAIQTALEGLILRPDSLSARMVLSLCYLDRGDINRGISELEKILSQDSRHLLALKTLIRCYEKEGNLQKAHSAAQYLLKEFPHDMEVKGKMMEWTEKHPELSWKDPISPEEDISSERVEGFSMKSANHLFHTGGVEGQAMEGVEELRLRLTKGQANDQARWKNALNSLTKDPKKARRINLLSNVLLKLSEISNGN